jgi:heme-degrading monooxygenase HmoA
VADPQPTIMMIVRGLKSKLPREEMERRAQDRMPAFRALPGLLQKYYSVDEATGEWAGIYLWDSERSMAEFMDSDLRKSIPEAYELVGPPRIEKFPLVDVLRR